jgi:hypothetical protein
MAKAQTSVGEAATLETLYGVEMPTAGVLAKGVLSAQTFLQEQGGALFSVQYAPLTNLTLGLSYSANNVLGNSPAQGQELPGVSLRWRIINETLAMPAIAIGFSNQGRGIIARNEFRTQSPGLYAAVSKSFQFWGTSAIHGGVHYSLEPSGDKRGVNAYVAAEKSLWTFASLAIEYNPTLQADMTRYTTKGLLNASLRCYLGDGFTVELQALDITTSLKAAQQPLRVFSLEYNTRL